MRNWCDAPCQPHVAYNESSIELHPMPKWYAGAKLGVFIHFGVYTVPVSLRPVHLLHASAHSCQL